MMERESDASSSSVVVYAAGEYLDLVKSARARDARHGVMRKLSAGKDARETARQLHSAGTYLRHQEALRALEENEKRQRQIARQNQKLREQQKFSRLMSKCADAMSASRDLGGMLAREDQLYREKCERQYRQWGERIFKPIQAQVAANLTEGSFQKLHDLRQNMHEDYLRACERPHGVFLQVPGPKPKEINMRYSSAKLKDPIKADLTKNVAEIAMAGTGNQFDHERQRSLVDPPDYLKVYPTERRHVRGPPSHKHILPNDHTDTELSCDDPEIDHHRELFPSSKRYYGSDINPQLLSEPDDSPPMCACCQCAHTSAVFVE